MLGLAFVAFSFSAGTFASVAFPTPPSFTFTVPASTFAASTSYYLAIYDPSFPSYGWQSRFETCTSSPTLSTLSCAGTAGYTFLANVTYTVGLYAVSAAAPTPTAAPSATAVAVATATPTAAAKPTATPTPAGTTPSSAPVATATPTVSPSASPTASPAPIPSASISSAGGSINFPNVGGVTGQVTYPSAGGGGVVYGTALAAPGNGFAPPGGSVNILYSVIFNVTGSSSLFGDASAYAYFQMPDAKATGTTFYLATYNGGVTPAGTWVYAQFTGMKTSTGGVTSITFAPGTFPAASFNLTSGQPYGFALYSTTP